MIWSLRWGGGYGGARGDVGWGSGREQVCEYL